VAQHQQLDILRRLASTPNHYQSDDHSDGCTEQR
jgi:hypothetical protein